MSKNEMKVVEVELPKAHLIGICPSYKEEEKHKSMEELELLVKTMGLETVNKSLQKRDKPDRALYTGKGFLEEAVKKMEPGDVLIFDNDLMPSQVRNISQKFEIDVLDRTEVILEIFQQHARTKEARIQVDLARYEYELPRLRNMWQHLDRERGTASTGGISRGTGEKQIELDRRIVRNKIGKAKKDLIKIAEQKEMQRQYRFSHFKKVCVVGYTNAGKSTLFNALTDSNVLVEDKLFATLESTSRALNLEKGKEVILSDTVGFISQLPHHLVASFRATLQEVIDADLLLHVVDSSDEKFPGYIGDVEEVLTDIGAEGIETQLVFNKIDKIKEEKQKEIEIAYPDSIFVSAQEGINFEKLLDEVDKKLNIAHEVNLLLPHDQQKMISHLFELGIVLDKEYTNEGVMMKVLINDEDMYKFKEWKI